MPQHVATDEVIAAIDSISLERSAPRTQAVEHRTVAPGAKSIP
jgi:hypothetical protein